MATRLEWCKVLFRGEDNCAMCAASEFDRIEAAMRDGARVVRVVDPGGGAILLSVPDIVSVYRQDEPTLRAYAVHAERANSLMTELWPEDDDSDLEPWQRR